jgi:hypothetical protein
MTSITSKPGSLVFKDLTFRAFFLTLATLLLSTLALGQPTSPRFALTTAIGQGSDVGMSYAFSGHWRLNFGLGFSTSVPDSGATASSFSVQTGAWRLQPVEGPLSAFYGGAVEFMTRSGARSTGDIGLILQAGAEYSISPRFALGSLAGLEYWFGDTSASGREGSRFGTARVGIFLTWWVL